MSEMQEMAESQFGSAFDVTSPYDDMSLFNGMLLPNDAEPPDLNFSTFPVDSGTDSHIPTSQSPTGAPFIDLPQGASENEPQMAHSTSNTATDNWPLNVHDPVSFGLHHPRTLDMSSPASPLQPTSSIQAESPNASLGRRFNSSPMVLPPVTALFCLLASSSNEFHQTRQREERIVDNDLGFFEGVGDNKSGLAVDESMEDEEAFWKRVSSNVSTAPPSNDQRRTVEHTGLLMKDNIPNPFLGHLPRPTDCPSTYGAVANPAQRMRSLPSLSPKVSRGYEANLPAQFGLAYDTRHIAPLQPRPQHPSASSRIFAGPSSIRPSQARQPHNMHHVLDAGARITRPRRPLSPVVVKDPHNATAVKRARNTEAVRQYNQRKVEKSEEDEARIVKLEVQNLVLEEALKQEKRARKAERRAFKKRIHDLEEEVEYWLIRAP